MASLALVVICGSPLGRLFSLEPGEYTIGRTDDCDIRVEGQSVSRRHARVCVDADQSVTLEDMGSTNGTYVQDEGLTGPTRIEFGAKVRVGPVVLKLCGTGIKETSTCATPLEPGIDPLTRLPNREVGRRRLRTALADPEQRPLSVLLIDVDGVAALNESLGYVSGDHLLVALCREIEAWVRDGDLLAYCGAGRWMVVAERMGLGAATELGEAIRSVVATMALPDGKPGSVTVSVGVACVDDDSEIEALARVEAALRDAKQTGRNRVCVGALRPKR